MFDLKRLVRPEILALQPYSTARDECRATDISVWLDANESPYDNGMNRYPDPHQKELKDAVARLKGVKADNIFIGGSGSDEAIDLCYRIFCRPGVDNAVALTPTYGVYEVAAAVNGVELRRVPLDAADYSLPADDVVEACDANTRLVWVCSPNNPTGNAFTTSELESLASRLDAVLVVDEAYVDFSDKGSMLGVLDRCPNLIVLQTFSKAWGLASLRVGMAFASPDIAALFAKVKYPYNVNGHIQRELLKFLETPEVMRRHAAETVAERARLAGALATAPGVERIYPSDGNFLLVKMADADATYNRLAAAGVLVRNRSRVPGCEGCLRITVGTPRQNDRVISLMGGEATKSGTHAPSLPPRTAEVKRKTRETDIEVYVDLDGNGESSIDTGLKFYDHMLSQLPHHAGITLRVSCKGDLEVDEHHTMEDVAIALGEALSSALGDKRGIERYGFVLPMDESRAMVLIDLGGRADFDWNVTFTRDRVGDTPTEMYSHVFKSLASAMKANIHVAAKGDNNHHIVEGVFKAFARALRMAIRRDPFNWSLPSSKGIL